MAEPRCLWHAEARCLLPDGHDGPHETPWSIIAADCDRLARENDDLRKQLHDVEVQAARPEPVDPADVRVGDVVEVEDEFGIWLIRGMVNAVDNGQLEIIHGSSRRVWVLVSGVNVHATVRLLRRAEPDPDPADVEALEQALALAEMDTKVEDGWHAWAVALARRGVRAERSTP